VSKRRVPTSELSRFRETVYAQYADKTLPTLDSTLALLGEGAGEGDDLSDYKLSRSTLHRAMTDRGFNCTRDPNHGKVRGPRHQHGGLLHGPGRHEGGSGGPCR